MPQPAISDVHVGEQLLTEPNHRIVQQGDQFCLVTPSGKTLRCYATQAEAEAAVNKVAFFKQFEHAHAALHDAYDRHRYTGDLSAASEQDTRKIAEAHIRLVAKAAEFGITHSTDHHSNLDVNSVVALTRAPSTEANMRKAAVRTDSALRYSLAPLYMPDRLDAHGEWTSADSLQKAVWELALSGDNDVRLQHHPDILSGKRVELVTWPYPVDAEFIVPGSDNVRKSRRVQLPAGTVYQGTIWEPWSWPLVLDGKLLGLSMGGMAQRRTGSAPHTLADFGQGADRVAKAWFAKNAPLDSDVDFDALAYDVELDADVEEALADSEDDQGVVWFGKRKRKTPRTKGGKRRKVHRVMSEFKEGSLTGRGGRKITSRAQAIAVALSEAGLSRRRKKKS